MSSCGFNKTSRHAACPTQVVAAWPHRADHARQAVAAIALLDVHFPTHGRTLILSRATRRRTEASGEPTQAQPAIPSSLRQAKSASPPAVVETFEDLLFAFFRVLIKPG
jgi:hypothetical protein